MRENHSYGTLCWWKMLKTKLSFKWYQSRSDLMRFLFWSLWTKWHHCDIIREESKFWTPLLNWIYLCQKGLFKIWHLIHKMSNFPLDSSTNAGSTAKFFSSCCWKTDKINRMKHKKQNKKTKIRTKSIWFNLNDSALKMNHSFP